MKFFKQRSSASDMPKANFDMLRAGLEVEIARPAVIAITSSTGLDGSDVASRGLAHSLASTGYPTLFIDATPSITRSRTNAPIGRTFEEIGRQVDPVSTIGNYVTLSLGDNMLQKTTSQRDIQLTLDSLKTKFDYIIIAVEHGVSTSFATSLVAAADAVLVTVRTGRREEPSDDRLAESLRRLGARFLGVVSLQSSVISADPSTLPNASSKDSRRIVAANLDQEFARREVAEWPT